MSDRGMMKWAPYRSLVEQSEFLDKMKYQKNRKPKPTLSEDQIQHINQVLVDYRGEIVSIKYYHNGYTYKVKTKIKKIDVENQRLIIEQGKMPFNVILDIENSEDL